MSGSASARVPDDPGPLQAGDDMLGDGVIALDGPSGTGKSTVARRLAQTLGARYLDTGAMYRALTLAALDRGVDLADTTAVAAAVAPACVDIGTDPRHPHVRLDGADVSARIRTAPVTAAVSAVSAVPEVRSQLVAAQRALIDNGGIVVEGRDIGTVVWPDAILKVFLTARQEVRARRRAGELGGGTLVGEVAVDLARRDGLDSSRAVSPLTRAADAVELDTSEIEIDEVVDRLVELVVTATHRRTG